MARMLRMACFVSFVALAAVSLAWAASCPYCGQTYGEGSGSDSAYIARIRAEHEATCPMRGSGGGSSGGGGNYGGGRDWEAEREAYIARADAHYDLGEQFYEDGDYDGAIKEASAALWMRWGNKKYTDLLLRAQARKRAQVNHETGLVVEKNGQWDAAISYFEAALREHPENETYAASLSRAREGRRQAEQARLDRKMLALGDELSKSYPSLALNFRAGGSKLPSIDRIQVPVPKIVEKDYVQIKVSKEWPEVPAQVVRLSNAALKVLQDGADFAYEKTLDWVEEQTVGKVVGSITDKIPGYDIYESLKEKHDEVYEGVSGYTLGLFESDMRAVRSAVGAVANPNDHGDAEAEHWRKLDQEGRRVQMEAMKLAGKSAKWGVEGEWTLGGDKEDDEGDDDKEKDHEKSGVVVIDKKKTDPYPDPFRIGPWVR